MIMVTGGAGYIGSHFVKTYLEQNPQSDVVVVDNLQTGHREAVGAAGRAHLVVADIGNRDQMRAVFERYPVEALVHFAASCYVGESQENPTLYFHNNVINTLQLMAAMEEAGLTRLLFSSTCATYGNPVQVPMDETHPQNPINVYGQTKLMMEMAMRSYCERLGWHVAALRYFNAAGADSDGLIGECHDPETHLIPLVLQTALGQRAAIDIYGDTYDTPDGTCIRDYIHVTDLADAHCRALKKLETQAGFEAFNLGTTTGTSVKAVIDLCREVTGREIPVRLAPPRPGDPPMLVANADKAREGLGWTTQRDMRTIIETAWNWAQNPRFGLTEPETSRAT